MKQGLRYRFVCKKDLNRGKMCETSKPNKAKIRISVSQKMPAYADKGLLMQDLTCMHRIIQEPQPRNKLAEKLSRNENPKQPNMLRT